MDRIQDRASKFISDVRKNKIKKDINVCADSKGEVKQNALPKRDLPTCFYCEKVFFNSKYLMKHILRRHSEMLILLYKKCLKHECSNNSVDMKCLYSFLKNEFVLLKSELKIVKQAVAGESTKNNTEASGDQVDIPSQENSDDANENSKKNENVAEVHLSEIEYLKEKISHIESCNQHLNDIFRELKNDLKSDVLSEIEYLKEKISHIESCNQHLNDTFKELKNDLKSDVLSKQDMKEYMDINNEKITRIQDSQRELRESLLEELQNLLSKQLLENNTEVKSQISKLKSECRRLDHIMGAIKKQIDSPDYMKTIEKKYEHQLNALIASMRYKNKNSMSKSAVNSVSENASLHNKTNKKTLNCKRDKSHLISQVSQNEVPVMLDEKLSHFGIPTNSSRISCAEYPEKLKLINLETEHLKMKNPNFSAEYNRINRNLDHKINLKLQNKKPRKVKFSEPLASFNDSQPVVKSTQHKPQPVTLNETEHSVAVLDGKPHDHECKQLEKIESEEERLVFADINGGGDYSRSYSDSKNHSFERAENQNYTCEGTFVTKGTQESKKTESQSCISKKSLHSACAKGTQEPKRTENQCEELSSPVKCVSEFKTPVKSKHTQKSIKVHENQNYTVKETSPSVKPASEIQTCTDGTLESKEIVNQNCSFEKSLSSVKSVSEFRPYTIRRSIRDFKNTEWENYNVEGLPTNLKTSTPLRKDTEQSKETENIKYSQNFLDSPVLSCPRKTHDWESSKTLSSSDYTSKDYIEKKFVKTGDCDFNSGDIDYDDVSSLESYNSGED